MKRLCLVMLGILSPALLIASIVLLAAHVMQNLVDDQVKQVAVLRNSSETLEIWENPPSLLLQIYFFNLTNPLEVLQGEIPIVKEIGPYTYREWKCREDVHILENGSKVSSFQPTTYFFEREMSVGDPGVDHIRTVNMPALVAMNLARRTPFHLPAELMLIIYQEDMFPMHTVQELLWGYTDKFLQAVHKFLPSVDPVFGYLTKTNGTSDGEYIMLSGENNYLDFTKIIEWQGKRKLNWWTSPSCNMINGTDGGTFHPLISKDETLYIFSSDFCRSIYLNFEKELTVLGVPAYRFIPPLTVFANVSVNPDNAGFCVPAGNCQGSGILNVTACKNGAPIFLSLPHFYHSEAMYINAVDGMHPNKEKHEPFLDVNPFTGALLQAAKQIQVNAYVETLPEFFQTGNIRRMVYPVMYMTERFMLDKGSAEKLKTALFESNMAKAVPYVILALGIISGAVFLAVLYWPRGKKEEGSADEQAPLIRT
ncbi:lysosome membrane protein 2 [Candoia aspera]|uniref:lysosome membrane protein 2 n=1 Tax=Candoia aspera TaxID=51853 RepID=UPI002FD8324D